MPAEKDLDPTDSMWAFFGSELRVLRKAAGLTQEGLGAATHSSGGFVGQIETAERRPKPELVADLDRIVDAQGRLVLIAHHAYKMTESQPGWFVSYTAAEQRATRIRVFEPQVIPGLLQVEEYADELFRQIRLHPAEAEQRRVRRMRRQEILRRRDPVELWAIIDEGALIRAARTERAARPQLEHLLQVIEMPNVILEVLPQDCGLHACMNGFMTLLQLPGHAECAYVEWMGGGQLITEATAVQEFARRYDLLRSLTLATPQSARLVRDLLEST